MRPEMRAFNTNVAQAGENVRRIGVNLMQATGNAREAASAVPELAREAASVAGERFGDVASRAGEATERAREVVEEARERAGRTATEASRSAVQLGAQILHLPSLVREGARRSVEVVEGAGARAMVTVIQAGTRALNKAADLVNELAPRHRVNRRALEELLVEQLHWAHTATEAFDETAAEIDDDETRVRLVRCKLQAIRQAETLMALMRKIGASVPAEERELPPPTPSTPERGKREPATARQGLAHALTIATQSAEGWRALRRIATLAQPDSLADALLDATTTVGDEPVEQVDFLREALLEYTTRAVLAD